MPAEAVSTPAATRRSMTSTSTPGVVRCSSKTDVKRPKVLLPLLATAPGAHANAMTLPRGASILDRPKGALRVLRFMPYVLHASKISTFSRQLALSICFSTWQKSE